MQGSQQPSKDHHNACFFQDDQISGKSLGKQSVWDWLMIHCLLGFSNNLITDLTDDPLNFWNLWPPVDRGKKCFDSSVTAAAAAAATPDLLLCLQPWFWSFVNSNLLESEHDLWQAERIYIATDPCPFRNLNISSVWFTLVHTSCFKIYCNWYKR